MNAPLAPPFQGDLARDLTEIKLHGRAVTTCRLLPQKNFFFTEKRDLFRPVRSRSSSRSYVEARCNRNGPR